MWICVVDQKDVPTFARSTPYIADACQTVRSDGEVTFCRHFEGETGRWYVLTEPSLHKNRVATDSFDLSLLCQASGFGLLSRTGGLCGGWQLVAVDS